MGLAFESFVDGSRIKEVITRYTTTGQVHGTTVLHRMRNPEYKTNPEQEQGKEQDHNI
jgi:hypothetical protein